jgi:hypothetical protein
MFLEQILISTVAVWGWKQRQRVNELERELARVKYASGGRTDDRLISMPKRATRRMTTCRTTVSHSISYDRRYSGILYLITEFLPESSLHSLRFTHMDRHIPCENRP